MQKASIESYKDFGCDIQRTLEWSSVLGDTEMLYNLIEQGVDIFSGAPILENACLHGRLEYVKCLVAKGVDVHIGDEAPLILASYKGHVEIVKILLANGADVHACNDTPLHEAVDKGHVEIIKLLLANGANVHALKVHVIEWTALLGFLDVLKILVDNGVDMNVNNGIVFYYACRSGNFEMVKYLEKMGVNIRGGDDQPLKEVSLRCDSNRHAGTEFGNYLEIMYFLVSKGSPIQLVSYTDRKYVIFRKKVEDRIRQNAAKKIYFWWIPICYDPERECGKRMLVKKYEEFVRLCSDQYKM